MMSNFRTYPGLSPSFKMRRLSHRVLLCQKREFHSQRNLGTSGFNVSWFLYWKTFPKHYMWIYTINIQREIWNTIFPKFVFYSMKLCLWNTCLPLMVPYCGELYWIWIIWCWNNNCKIPRSISWKLRHRWFSKILIRISWVMLQKINDKQNQQ